MPNRGRQRPASRTGCGPFVVSGWPLPRRWITSPAFRRRRWWWVMNLVITSRIAARLIPAVALDSSVRIILPRQGEVAPKATEGEDGDALERAIAGW